jgi:ketosteroid isomerase-like protein
MLRWFGRISLLLIFMGCAQVTSAADCDGLLRSTFEKWLAAYVNRDLTGTMSIFADDIDYSFQGAPDAKKADLKKSYRDEFARRNSSGRWIPEFEQLECFGKVGFVCSIWRLEVARADGKMEIKFENRSVDILRLADDGTWKIFRSVNYPVAKP